MKKVLCICALGRNRSKYLAKYLAKKGYETRYGGVNCGRCKECHTLCQKDVDWAQVIIIVRKRLAHNFYENYRWRRKKIIILDVTDSRKIAARKNPKWLKVKNKLFQTIYVKAHLRKAMQPHLPL